MRAASVARLVSIMAFALFLSSTPHAEKLPVKIYTSADGLGSSFVDSISRDSRGFMWFCTRDGLSRFDGSRFVTYKIGGVSSPPGVETLYEGRDGMYWVSTTGGTFRFDPNAVSLRDGVTPVLDAEYVSSWRGHFFEDGSGNFWLASGPLFRLVYRDGKPDFEKVDLGLPPKPNTTFLSISLAETPDRSLWLHTSWGLARRLPDGRTIFYPYDQGTTVGNSSMMADRDGLVWLSRPSDVLVIRPEPIDAFSSDERKMIVKDLRPNRRVDLEIGMPPELPAAAGEVVSLHNPAIAKAGIGKRLYQTSDGEIWITAEKSLIRIGSGSVSVHGDENGLPNAMAGMHEDAAGNLWIGGQAGLARLNRNGLVSYGRNGGSDPDRFLAISEGADGAMYFAARDFRISRFDGKKFTTVRPRIDPDAGLSWTSRYSYLATNGDWWILSNLKLYRFAGVGDFEQLEGREPTNTYTSADGLKADGAFQIFEDRDGGIWVSTRGTNSAGHGLSVMERGGERFRTFGEADGLPPNKAPASFAQDARGRIWIGFYEGGLARFDGERFETFDEGDGLPDGLISDILFDSKGRLWIGSALGGLIRVDDADAARPSFSFVTTADGLASNNVRTLAEDDFGRIYVGTVRGIDRYSPDGGGVKHYTVSDGIAGDFVTDSRRGRNGVMWFATNNGVSKLVPNTGEKSDAPRILLGALKISGVEHPVSSLGDDAIEIDELAHSDNNFQVEFFALDFRAGETLRYQYKLEGVDADWSEPAEQRTVTFANLRPDSYRFLVRAVNSDGLASETPAVLSFRIDPPFWQRWWFVLGCAAAGFVIVFLLYRYRTARLREVNAALEEARLAEAKLGQAREERLAELEKVRSRIATDLHDDIGASLTQIAVLSEVAQARNGNGGSAAPLKRITEVSNALVGTMSDIVWSINPAKDHFSDLTQRMRRFASDLLSPKGIRVQFRFPDTGGEIIVNSNVRREAFLVFKEAVNNIARHSNARGVTINLETNGKSLSLRVKDDGDGFDATAQTPGGTISSGGNGIANMRRRAKEMNGELHVESAPGSGTTVHLSLPIEQQRQSPD